mgnify:CR=1 FL=1
MHHPSGLGDFHFCQMNFFSLIHNNLPLDKSMILTKLLVIYSQPGWFVPRLFEIGLVVLRKLKVWKIYTQITYNLSVKIP